MYGRRVHPELEDWRSRGASFDYLGFDVFYVSEGSGPHLLLVHGYPFNSFDWVRIWRALTAEFTVIAPDMLGMGFSDKPVDYEYSVHAHADMHEALLKHLGVETTHILAHDIGDSVVQEMLARHEEAGSSGAGVRDRVDHLAERRPLLRDLPPPPDPEAPVDDALRRSDRAPCAGVARWRRARARRQRDVRAGYQAVS